MDVISILVSVSVLMDHGFKTVSNLTKEDSDDTYGISRVQGNVFKFQNQEGMDRVLLLHIEMHTYYAIVVN